MRLLQRFRKAQSAPPTPVALPPPRPRSPLLRPLARPTAAGRWGRIIRRSMAWAAIIGGATWLIWAVRSQSLGSGWLADTLYLIHDAIYLPIKGYTFTLLFPTSLAWYGLILTIGLIWLSFFVADRSWVRRPHLALLRLLVLMPLFGAALAVSARLLTRVGFPPGQLLIVAEHERDLRTIQLAANPRDTGAARQLTRLTSLLIHLRTVIPGELPALQAWADWQLALALLRFCDLSKATRALVAPRLLQPLLSRTLARRGANPLDALGRTDDLFGSTGVIADLLRLAALAGFDLSTLHTDGAPPPPDRDQLIYQLLQAAELRRRAVDQLRGQFELTLIQPTIGRITALSLAPDATEAELPLLGAIALRSALLTALEADTHDSAAAMIDAYEALGLAVAMLPADPTTPELGMVARRALAWLADLPTPLDYQLVASLAIERVVAGELPWDTYLAQERPIISRSDLAMDRSSVDGLFHAGGDAHHVHLREHLDPTP